MKSTRSTARSKAPKQVQLFVSYSHMNQLWFGRLSPLLKFKTQPNIAHAWHDHQLQTGERWDQEIREALRRMDVFICLVSFEFVASDYIMDVELPLALEREKKREIEIVPIVLFPIDLQRECPPLHEFQRLPTFDQCWSVYEQNGGHYQNAHKPIRDGLWQVIERVRSRRD